MLKKKNQRTSSSCFGEPVLVVHVRDSFVVNESVATDSSLVYTPSEKGLCGCLRGLYYFPLILLLSLPFSPQQCASPLPSWAPDASTQSQFNGNNSSFVFVFSFNAQQCIFSKLPVMIENSGFLLTSTQCQIR